MIRSQWNKKQENNEEKSVKQKVGFWNHLQDKDKKSRYKSLKEQNIRYHYRFASH